VLKPKVYKPESFQGLTQVVINTCSRWELLRLPGVGNKIADKICKMREEGVQFTRDNLVNIPYLANSPELLEKVCMNHYYLMTQCITELFDQYLRNYYFSLVLKPKVYKPESFQGLTQVVMKHREYFIVRNTLF
jgi:hypothetical protein